MKNGLGSCIVVVVDADGAAGGASGAGADAGAAGSAGALLPHLFTS